MRALGSASEITASQLQFPTPFHRYPLRKWHVAPPAASRLRQRQRQRGAQPEAAQGATAGQHRPGTCSSTPSARGRPAACAAGRHHPRSRRVALHAQCFHILRWPSQLAVQAGPSIDDPFSGRLLTLPLQPGEYAATVHIPLPAPPATQWGGVCAFVTAACAAFPHLRPLWRPEEPPTLHVSLSRPFAMRRVQAASAAKALRKELTSRRVQLPWTVTVSTKPVALVNEHGTRTFLALALEPSCRAPLATADAAADVALGRHGVEPHLCPGQVFCPHISLAWAPGDVASAVEGAAAAAARSCASRLAPWEAQASCVQFRLGSRTAVVYGQGASQDPAVFT